MPETIFLDHHSTTPVFPEVIDVMAPWLRQPANPHSQHTLGRAAAAAVQNSIASIAEYIGTDAEKILVTSGATESNQLAIEGFCCHPRQSRRQIVTIATEHPAVLDVLKTLQRRGFETVFCRTDSCGRVDLSELRNCCNDDTALVSIAWANNEIGVVADLSAIADVVHQCGAVLHSDATQMVGRRRVDISSVGVDLLSASSHKFYGPRGCGLLVVGGGGRCVRLLPQIVGGGQQRGLRGGTLDVASIVGMAEALRRCESEMDDSRQRMLTLRNQLWTRLRQRIAGLDDDAINGPPLDADDRLEGNLNFTLPLIEGEAWIAATDQVAFSSGSACSSVDEKPSHVLTAIGRDESWARRSVRFGLGVGTQTQDIDAAVEWLAASYGRLTGG